MFKLKYNFLVIIGIIFALLNATLLLNLYGVSKESDAFFLATSIMTALQIILIIPIAQFLPFYNDYKSLSIKKSHDFYNYLLIVSMIFGAILCLFFYFGANIIIQLFAANIDTERFIILKKLISIMFCGVAFTTSRELNFQLLNAEMKFSVPYILEMLPNIFIVMAQLYLIFTHSNNIYLLAYAYTLSYISSVLVSCIVINKTLIKFYFINNIGNLTSFFKNSFSMQLGKGIYHFLLPIALNNFLVTLSTGYVSCFYYARKIIDIVNNLLLGPSARILRSRIAKMLSHNNLNEIKKNINLFLLFSILLFIIGMLVMYYLQEPILKFVSNYKLSESDLIHIKRIFLSLIPWYFFMVAETPFVILCTNAKKGLIFICVNALFIILLNLVLLFSTSLGVYAIGFATAIAQFSNFINYQFIGKKILSKL